MSNDDGRVLTCKCVATSRKSCIVQSDVSSQRCSRGHSFCRSSVALTRGSCSIRSFKLFNDVRTPDIRFNAFSSFASLANTAGGGGGGCGDPSDASWDPGMASYSIISSISTGSVSTRPRNCFARRDTGCGVASPWCSTTAGITASLLTWQSSQYHLPSYSHRLANSVLFSGSMMGIFDLQCAHSHIWSVSRSITGRSSVILPSISREDCSS